MVTYDDLIWQMGRANDPGLSNLSRIACDSVAEALSQQGIDPESTVPPDELPEATRAVAGIFEQIIARKLSDCNHAAHHYATAMTRYCEQVSVSLSDAEARHAS